MSGEKHRFFSGATEAQAVMEAAGHFGLLPAELAYRTVEKTHGFLRRQHRAVIVVDPENPRRSTAPSVPMGPVADVEAAPPPPVAAAGEQARLATPVASGVDGAVHAVSALARLARLQLEATATLKTVAGEDAVSVEIAGPDQGRLVEQQGELLRAVEYLLRRMVKGLPTGGLELDSGGFRARREETLQRRARAVADEVRRTGESFLFEALPAAERRVVHLVIQEEAGVHSASEGESEPRRLRVSPAAAR